MSGGDEDIKILFVYKYSLSFFFSHKPNIAPKSPRSSKVDIKALFESSKIIASNLDFISFRGVLIACLSDPLLKNAAFYFTVAQFDPAY